MSYYGLHVDVASTGAEAIAMCKGKPYDLIFMDQMMPEMDGTEAMTRIRRISGHYAASGHCKIIALTANAISGVREELLAAGFDEYLSKPLDFRHLDAVLLKFLPPEAFDSMPGPSEVQAGTDIRSENSGDASNTPDPDDKNDALVKNTLNELLPDVTITDGILHCGGSCQDYMEVLRLMYESSDEQLAQLQQHASLSDWKDFSILAHALKGSCLNIGATGCGEAAKKLEMAGREEDSGYIAAHLEPFLAQYRGLMQEIKEVLLGQGLMEASGSGTADGSCRAILDKFGDSILEFDFAQAGVLLKKAHHAPDAAAYTALLSELDPLMEALDVDRIQSALKKIPQT
jgi:CheY-like chemotaxis protein